MTTRLLQQKVCATTMEISATDLQIVPANHRGMLVQPSCRYVEERTWPLARNHSTASASACLGGVCGRPSSRMAFAGLNHILYFAMRTPATGATGGLPVSVLMASLTCAAARATE